MELNVDLPRLSDAAAPDVKRLYAGVIRLTEQLKFALSNLDEGNFTPELRESVGGTPSVKREVTGLKEAIIRTATLIKSAEEKITSTMKNEYVAVSDIGTYTENAVASYEVDGRGIDQYFDLVSSVAGEVDRLAGYIRTGVLDGGAIGVEIGDLTSGDAPFKVRLTGDRLSFFSDGAEVAYMSSGALYITKAKITGKLTLGDYELDVTDGIAVKYIGA